MPQIEATTLITFNPPCVRADQTVIDALDLICQWQLTELPVIDRDQRVLGIVQLRHLVALADADAGALHSVADQYISDRPDPFTLRRFPRIALQQLLAKGYRSVPVVDEGRLIGMLSRSDFLREFAASGSRLAGSAVLEHTTTAAESLDYLAKVEDAFAAMAEDKLEQIAIVQRGCPLAACTRDELQTAVEFARAAELMNSIPAPSRTVMDLIRPATHLQPGQSLADAAQVMSQTGATALLVVNKARRILGIITEKTVLSLVLRGT